MPAAPRDPEGIAAHLLLRASPLPAAEARVLLCHILGVTRERLAAHPQTVVAADDRRRYDQAAARRLGGVPLAYLTGGQEFYGHHFLVSPAVLVPRPDTELLVDTALHLLENRPAARVLELGTGSGCIALAIALARPDLAVLATDRSWEALQVARANQLRLGARVQFLMADWYEGLSGRFDLIVSNPPYIAAGDTHLPALADEPAGALVAGADGLDDLRELAAGAPAQLAPGGWLLLEHGYDQGPAVRDLLCQAGLHDVQTLRDLAGHERACRGSWQARPA
jgi:release factor glutamine methyltransferase